MTEQRLHLIAAVLVALAFVLITWGLQAAEWMWMTGLALTALAFGAALAIHWAPEEDGEGEEEYDGERERGGPRQETGSGQPGPHEHRARAHEERAAAHEERAKAHEERAEVELERARRAREDTEDDRKEEER